MVLAFKTAPEPWFYWALGSLELDSLGLGFLGQGWVLTKVSGIPGARILKCQGLGFLGLGFLRKVPGMMVPGATVPGPRVPGVPSLGSLWLGF